eukprot:CAMPEP_0167803852 /NCGR_PEP_ID=MMETSP0111_2-20121227/20110_1 /TAXON_ID=91324 /ORGANISM="Lotharella globosa, Strain CCCM811" /LENGTH=228 /DNA_ID=CAMNT_0007700455 /DNA_START=40 /DNA_END=723 /DNA_ORIENTATION=+
MDPLNDVLKVSNLSTYAPILEAKGVTTRIVRKEAAGNGWKAFYESLGMKPGHAMRLRRAVLALPSASGESEADRKFVEGWRCRKFREEFNKHRKKGKELIIDAMNNGSVVAKGYCYFKGWGGLEIDRKEAVRWYRAAAEEGNTQAQINLGGCYLKGIGVDRDFEEAVKWHRKSAEFGNSDAQFILAHGLSVIIGKEEAMKWHRKSAELGNHFAMFNLGKRLEKGKGME